MTHDVVLDSADVVRAARRRPARRYCLVVCGLVVAVVGAFLARTLLGDYTITIPDAIRIIGGEQIPGATFILMESKLPRAVLGTFVGFAFGVGGAIFQATLRNPLASPDIIGVSYGASAAGVFGILVLDTQGAELSVIAVAGALLVAGLIRLIGGSARGMRLVVMGIAIAAALQSTIQYLFTRADIYDAQAALRWLTGSLNEADWPTIRILALTLVVLLVLTALLAGSLRSTELGPDTAAGLGIPERHTDLLMAVGALLVAVAVAAAGPIAFVAFLSGPIARALNAGRTTLLAAGLVGSVIVLVADHLGAYLIEDVNFPVGVVTGAFGAPILLWLLATLSSARRT
ncbi:MAG: iron chelate uptake ABC transporter family permease subunit [Streptosporangiales bacterium]|nr:iron chelate uptake ABC transporter family permease subunit [Streptosporangiales bacterium]